MPGRLPSAADGPGSAAAAGVCRGLAVPRAPPELPFRFALPLIGCGRRGRRAA